MSKYILTLLLMPILSNVYADEPDPYGNNPIEYLANKDVILYAAKIGEPVSFIKYYDYFSSGISSLSEERIRKNWQEQMSQLPQKYLVIKVLRGDDIVEGDIIDTDTPKSFSTTRIGRKYILFLNGHVEFTKFVKEVNREVKFVIQNGFVA